MAIMPGRSDQGGVVCGLVSHCALWERLGWNAENRRSSSAGCEKIGRMAVDRQTAAFGRSMRPRERRRSVEERASPRGARRRGRHPQTSWERPKFLS